MKRVKKLFPFTSVFVLDLATQVTLFAQSDTVKSSTPHVSFPDTSTRWTMLVVAGLLLGGLILLLNATRRRADKSAGL